MGHLFDSRAAGRATAAAPPPPTPAAGPSCLSAALRPTVLHQGPPSEWQIAVERTGTARTWSGWLGRILLEQASTKIDNTCMRK